MLERRHFEDLDRDDPLAFVGKRFTLPPGLVYLDGNSLGPLPSHVPAVVDEVVRAEWGRDLITSWNRNGWWELSRRVGERVAPLVGAPPGTVIAGDSTTVALYKVLAAARRLRPDRRVLLSDVGNFPTDLYVLESVASQFDADLVAVEPEGVMDAIDGRVAVVALTHVDYRTGRRHDLEDTTAAAHASNAMMVWDLSHSAGAMDLDVSEADMAVGCGYKYLNGGPGAPSFLYVHQRHQASFHNPINGWWGHAEPFAMEPSFRPAPDLHRVQLGTQPILSMAAFDAALDVFDGVDPAALRRKSERLTADFISLVDHGLERFDVVTPREADERGSHVSLSHPEATAIIASLIEHGVVGDVRPPDLLRFGFSPTFQRHVDVWEAVQALRRVTSEQLWRDADSVGPVT